MSFFVIGSGLCFTHLSNIGPKGLSFRVDGVFPILYTKPQKTQTNSGISAHKTKTKPNEPVAKWVLRGCSGVESSRLVQKPTGS